MRASYAIVIMLCTLAFPSAVSADGCSGGVCSPADLLDPAMSMVHYIDGDLTLTGVERLDGFVNVNGSLTIKDCTLTLNGIGIAVGEGGSVTIMDSTIAPSASNLTCLLSVQGPLTIERSTLRGFTDPREVLGLIGFYVRSPEVRVVDSQFLDSGIFIIYNSTSSFTGSRLPGAFLQGGSGSFDDCTVDGYGITYDGPGWLKVDGCEIGSEVQFVNGVSGISATGGGDLIVSDTLFMGTYSAGIFAQDVAVEVHGCTMDLGSAIYGLKVDLAEIVLMQDIRIADALTGISVYDCTNDLPVGMSGISIEGGSLGLEVKNTVPTTIKDSSFKGAEIGVRSLGPIVLMNVTFRGAQVAALFEGGYENDVTGCHFIEYTSWAIQEQSWDPTFYPDNEFEPSEDSPGEVAWWGYVTTEVVGSGEAEVKGASLTLRSDIGEYKRTPGRIDVIWGYSSGGSPVEVVYDGEARWGSSSTGFAMDPAMGLTITVVIPLGDMFIGQMDRDGDRLVLTLGMAGTGSGTADLTVFVDDRKVHAEAVELRSGEQVSVVVPVEVPSGTHRISAEITSPDEFHGGILQMNNVGSITVESDEDDWTGVGLWAIVIGSFLALALAIIYDRRNR